jgi:hypothetical protein
MMTVDLVISILQFVAGALLLVTTGIAGWALKQVVRLRGDHERLKGKVIAESDNTNRRFGEMHGWLKAISEKLDTLILGLIKKTGD